MDDEFLMKLGLEKGTRKLINHEERGNVLQAMDGCSYKAAAGGSLSNTLVALARLGCQSTGDRPLNVAMAGSIGGDPLGSFYRYRNCLYLNDPLIVFIIVIWFLPWFGLGLTHKRGIVLMLL